MGWAKSAIGYGVLDRAKTTRTVCSDRDTRHRSDQDARSAVPLTGKSSWNNITSRTSIRVNFLLQLLRDDWSEIIDAQSFRSQETYQAVSFSCALELLFLLARLMRMDQNVSQPQLCVFPSTFVHYYYIIVSSAKLHCLHHTSLASIYHKGFPYHRLRDHPLLLQLQERLNLSPFIRISEQKPTSSKSLCKRQQLPSICQN